MRFLSAVILIFCSLSLRAQIFSPGFISLTTEDGLPSNIVVQTLQDSRGYLWVATYNGLCRYDGYSFKTYLSSTVQSSGNEDHSPVTHIFEDSDEKLWVGTTSGKLYRYERKIDDFVLYEGKRSDSKSAPTQLINEISEDDRKRIWIAAGTTIYCLPNKNKDSLILVKDYEADWQVGGKHFRIKQIVHDGNTKWIAVSGLGIKRITLKKDLTFNEPVQFTALNSPPDFHYPIRLYDSGDSLFVAYAEAIVCIDKSTMSFADKCSITPLCSSSGMNINSFLSDDSEVWLSLKSNGLIYYNRHTGSYGHYHQKSTDQYSLLDNNINHLYKDRAGNVWISTSRGLNKLTPVSHSLQHLAVPAHIKHTESSIGVRCVFEASDKTLWLGTKGSGLLELTPDGGINQHLQEEWREEHNVNFVQNIKEAPDGKLWVATYRGLAIFDRKTERFTSLDLTNGAVPLHYQFTWALYTDQKQYLYVGMLEQGLFLYDFLKKQVTKIQFVENGDTISKIDVLKLKRMNDGKLWITTNTGIWLYNPAHDKNAVTEQLDIQNKGGSPIVWDFKQIDDENIWMTSTNMGLYNLSLKNHKHQKFSISSGLPTLALSALIHEDEDKLWVSSVEGLSLFNTRTRAVERIYSHADGLPSMNFFYGSSYKSDDGFIYFGNDKGVLRFAPHNIQVNNYTPNTIITSVEADYVYRPEALAASELQLDHDESSLLLTFASLDFTNPFNNKFRYKLTGVDNNWVESHTINQVNYTGLPPGQYTFMVEGTNSNGIWSGSIASFDLTVKPAFWQTTIFKASITVLALAILSVISGMFLYSQNEKRKVLRAELVSLRSQLNPHFIFNSLNSLQYFIISQREEEALDYLSGFSRLMRKILEYSGRTYISLLEEREFLSLYLDMEAARNDTPFDYNIYIADELIEGKYCIPPMIIQPFAENSIAHGLIGKVPQGMVAISFEKAGNFLRCTVEDNGIGREQALKNKKKKTESFSTQAISDSLNKIRKYAKARPEVKIVDLYDTSGKPTGTRVIIDLPLIDNDRN